MFFGKKKSNTNTWLITNWCDTRSARSCSNWLQQLACSMFFLHFGHMQTTWNRSTPPPVQAIRLLAEQSANKRTNEPKDANHSICTTSVDITKRVICVRFPAPNMLHGHGVSPGTMPRLHDFRDGKYITSVAQIIALGAHYVHNHSLMLLGKFAFFLPLWTPLESGEKWEVSIDLSCLCRLKCGTRIAHEVCVAITSRIKLCYYAISFAPVCMP